jgi:hypothetical protein
VSRPNSQADGLDNEMKQPDAPKEMKNDSTHEINAIVDPTEVQSNEQPKESFEIVNESEKVSKPASRVASEAQLVESGAIQSSIPLAVDSVEPETETALPLNPIGVSKGNISQSKPELTAATSNSNIVNSNPSGQDASKISSRGASRVPSKESLAQSKSNLATSKSNLNSNDPTSSKPGSPASLRKVASVKFSQQLESTTKSQTSLVDKNEIKSSLKKSKNDLHGSKSLQDLSPKRSQSSLASKSTSNLRSDNEVISIPVPPAPTGPSTDITPLTNRRVIMDETMRLPSKSASLKRKQMKPVTETEVEYDFTPRPPVSRTPSRFQSVTREELESESIPV